MSKIRLPLGKIIIGMILSAILIVGLNPSVIAQDPDRDSMVPVDANKEMEEEELEPLLSTQEPEIRDTNPPSEQTTTVEEESNRDDSSRVVGWFQFISANTFVPYNSSMTYVYYNSGCMYRTGGGDFTEHTLQLPQGAEIDYLRVYYYDNDPTHNVRADLYAYDGYGDNVNIASASSSGAVNSYQSMGSGFFSYTVNNEAEALSLSLYYGGATTNLLRICGVRIRYQYNPYATFLPLLKN
jgi:hypothetical protein